MSILQLIKRVLKHIKYRTRHLVRNLYFRAKYNTAYDPKKHILLDGFPESQNFGDALNIYLVEFLSGKKVIPSRYARNADGPIYAVIGSILHWVKSGVIAWGSGLISAEVKAPADIQVKAVRGPLTRDILISQGIECPQVYGDPALLLPLIYQNDVPIKYRVGFLPHYCDRNHPALQNLAEDSSYLVIDIETGSNVLPLIDQVRSCEVIATSSLHGMILAHTYGIPCVWVGFFGNLLGDTFKFRDYLLSVGKEIYQPLKIKEKICEDQLLEHMDDSPISWDPNIFIEACPFINDKVKKQILTKVKNRQ